MKESNIVNFVNENKESIIEEIKILDLLKKYQQKENWQLKANELVKRVSGNDFRYLNWKEIYQLIRKTAK